MNKLSYKLQEYPGMTGSVIASLFGLLVKALASYGFNLISEMEVFITALIVAVFPVVGASVACACVDAMAAGGGDVGRL